MKGEDISSYDQNKKLTIADVARDLGVSKSTVSRAISGKGRIGKETRKKVTDYIEKNQYRPNVMARGLAQSKTFNIALVLPGDFYITELPFFQNCMLGISQTASLMDYDVVISMITQEDITQLERVINHHKVDGVILSQIQTHDVALDFLKRKNVPFVVIGSISDTSVVQIDNDHIGGCRELTKLMLMQGYRNIALLGGNPKHLVTQRRYQGYQEAFAQMQQAFLANQIYFDMQENYKVEKVIDELLTRNIECIFCMDDYICMQTISYLKKKNIDIPREVKIASFYNSQLLKNNIPGITSLQFDARKLGIDACKILIEMMQGKTVSQYTLLGFDMIIKESTKL